MPSPARARLVDVAALAEVAPSTASRALAGSSAIAPATVERVQAAAAELGYLTNLAAAGLKRGRTLNIGLLAIMSYWYAGAVTSGADRVAAQHGYDFVVVNSGDGTNPDLLLERARRLGQRVDGALIVDLEEGPLLDKTLEALGVPAVTVGCQAPNNAAVLVDNLAIGGAAARHMSDLGHERAVVLTVENPSPFAFDNQVVRAEGFAETFPGTSHVARVPSGNHDLRRRSIREACTGVTAVFCISDELAIEASAVLTDAGWRVPAEISVMGVDDHPLAGPLGLTTIEQQPNKIGQAAAELLLEQLSRSDTRVEPEEVTMPTRLLPRRSTARVYGH